MGTDRTLPPMKRYQTECHHAAALLLLWFPVSLHVVHITAGCCVSRTVTPCSRRNNHETRTSVRFLIVPTRPPRSQIFSAATAKTTTVTMTTRETLTSLITTLTSSTQTVSNGDGSSARLLSGKYSKKTLLFMFCLKLHQRSMDQFCRRPALTK